MTQDLAADDVRVLVADDNADHAFFTVRALCDSYGPGVSVDTVEDGQQALDYLNQHGKYAGRPRPHLIVLDLKMPRRSGWEVLAKVKADAALRSIPVVVLSSSDGADDVETSYRLGANSYVTKPVGAAGLGAGVRALAAYWLRTAALPAPPV